MTDATLPPNRKWPYRPDLAQFKRQAKELLKSFRAGDANAVAEVQWHEQIPDSATFALHDAQRVRARSYGFASWQKLRSYVQTIEPYWRPMVPKSDDIANKFLRLACITYFDGDHPLRRDRARQLFAEKPYLAKASLYTAAAVGDVAAASDFLANGADVHAKGGPFDWEPLLYAAYSRLDSLAEGHSTLAAARLLIEHGADPNAGFLWEGGYLFTALTGVLGLGEDDVFRGEGPLWQPPHQQWVEFARLLLEAGADPNDNQGLYNRMQYPNDEHLKLLFEYGLGKNHGGPWFKRFFQNWPYAYAPRSPSDILAYQLRWAISANYFDRVKLLVENGADVNATSQYPVGARAPYAEAVYHGHQQIADYLVAMGAKRISITLSAAEEFHLACYRNDADRARELVATNPLLLDDAGRGLLTWAAEAGRVDSLRLLVELGADVNGYGRGIESVARCADRSVQAATAAMNLGDALREQGDYEGALDIYGDTLRLHPEYDYVHFAIGLTLVALNRLDEAAGKMQDAIRLRPELGNGYWGWSEVLVRQKKLTEAEAALREGLKRDAPVLAHDLSATGQR